jgi:uncharacterized protein (TIGR02996 family)
MNEEEAFEAALIANPRDVVGRLAFADWCDEHDQAARARYLRQIRIRKFALLVSKCGPGATRPAPQLPVRVTKWWAPSLGDTDRSRLRVNIWLERIKSGWWFNRRFFIKSIEERAAYLGITGQHYQIYRLGL